MEPTYTDTQKIAIAIVSFLIVLISCFAILSAVNSVAVNGLQSCESLHLDHLQNPGDQETIMQAWEVGCPFQDKDGNYLYEWNPSE